MSNWQGVDRRLGAFHKRLLVGSTPTPATKSYQISKIKDQKQERDKDNFRRIVCTTFPNWGCDRENFCGFREEEWS